MRPTRVWAKNCRSWQALDCSLPVGVTAVVGENGAGKSTLVNIVDLALFASPRELPRLLSRNANSDGTLELGCEFEHHGQVYRVRRTYTPAGGGKSRLDFERDRLERASLDPLQPDWEPLTKETQATTQQAIEALLGVSRTTFRASAFLAQGDGAAFTAAAPRERKAILAQALGLEVYERLLALAREALRKAEGQATAALSMAEQCEREAEHRPDMVAQVATAAEVVDQRRLVLEELDRGLAAARKEHQAAVAAATAYRAAEQHARSARNRLGEAEEQLGTLKARAVAREARLGTRAEVVARHAALPELEAAEVALAEANRLHTTYEAAQEQAERARGELARLGESLGALHEELREVEAGGQPCPTCKQPLKGEAQAEAVTTLRAAWGVRKAEAERATRDADRHWQRACEAREQELAYLDKVPEHLRQHGALKAQLAEARAAGEALAALAELEAQREADEAEVARLEQQVPELRKAVTEAEAQLAEHEAADPVGLQRRVANTEAKVASERAALEGAVRHHEQAQAAVQHLDELGRRAGEHRAALAEHQREVAVYEALARAFGPDGIPALITENAAIPQIEAEANRVVAALGRSYRFELRTERALKTRAGTAEALDIVVYADGGEAAYEDFSGGERTRLDLALRLGLARLLAGRRGAEVGLLAIDEPSYLDEGGFERLASVLQGLQAEFPCILVVSHVPALREAFDQVLAVSGGGDSGTPSTMEVAT